MDDKEFRDLCAASALGGLIARCEDSDEDIRHRYHVLAIEAYRAAEEMVELRASRYSEPS